MNWDLTGGGNENMILRVKQRNHSMQQAEGGKIPREDLSLPLQYHRRETGAKIHQKQEENTNAGCLVEEKQKKIILCKIPTKRFPVWTTGLQNIPTHLGGGKQKKRRKKLKKDSHQKTQASCTSQQTIFLTGPSREQFNHDLSVVSLFYSEWDLTDF